VIVIAYLFGDDWKCDHTAEGLVTLASNVVLIVALVPILTWMGCKLRKYPSDGRCDAFLLDCN